jgi:heme/copper-type cytochrome/quinol oxidase subunit 2
MRERACCFTLLACGASCHVACRVAEWDTMDQDVHEGAKHSVCNATVVAVFVFVFVFVLAFVGE